MEGKRGFGVCSVRFKHGLYAGGCLLAISWGFVETAPAYAQEAGAQDAGGGLQEIVVTAQKREERLQDVPISVAAFDANAIKASGSGDVSQLSKLTPNVTLDNGSLGGGSTSVLSAFIRGIGLSDFAFNFDPGVGVYLDGVYLGRTVGANMSLPDVERVEVLKGPQGTLFGRNTIAGAVNIVTRSPGRDFAFEGDVTAGRFDRLQVRGYVQAPLGDTLAASLAFNSEHRDGYLKRLPFDAQGLIVDNSWLASVRNFGSPESEGGMNQWSLRGKLVWEPSADFRMTLSGDYTNIDSSNIPVKLIRTYPQGQVYGLYSACLNTPVSALQAAGLYLACSDRGPTQSNYAGANANGITYLPYDDRFVTDDPDTTYATGPSYEKTRTYGVNLTAEYDLAAATTLKGIFAYRRLKWDAGSDLDGSPIEYIAIKSNIYQRQYSAEMQLIGKEFNDKLDYVLGVYFFDEESSTDDHVSIVANLLQINQPANLRTKAYAAFAHLTYKLTDALGVTLGARYTREDKTVRVGIQDLNAFNYKLAGCYPPSAACAIALGYPDPSQPLLFQVDTPFDQSFNDFSPRIGVDYHINRDLMLYGSYSRGYKSGGWTTRLTNPINASTPWTFRPEKAETWEAGFKSEWLGRSLRLNGAFFYTDYSGIQLNFKQAISPTIQNAGSARIWGLEGELIWAPDRNFTLTTSAGYINARYKEINAATGLTIDNDLPKTPEFKWVTSATYRFYLPGGASITPRIDYAHTSSLFNDPENSALIARPATDELGASITFDPGNNWTLTVGGTNITDERYITTGEAQLAGGEIYATYNRPAEWYARVGVKF